MESLSSLSTWILCRTLQRLLSRTPFTRSWRRLHCSSVSLITLSSSLNQRKVMPSKRPPTHVSCASTLRLPVYDWCSIRLWLGLCSTFLQPSRSRLLAAQECVEWKWSHSCWSLEQHQAEIPWRNFHSREYCPGDPCLPESCMFLKCSLTYSLTFFVLVDSPTLRQFCHDPLPSECWSFEIGVGCTATATNVIRTDPTFCSPTLSYQRLQTVQPLSDEELYDKIRRSVPNKQELQVLESFLIFNKSVYPLFTASGN